MSKLHHSVRDLHKAAKRLVYLLCQDPRTDTEDEIIEATEHLDSMIYYFEKAHPDA